VVSLQSGANARLALLKLTYDRAMSVIREEHAKLLSKVQPTYGSFWSGYVNFDKGLRNIIGFSHFANMERRFAPEFLISEVGDEIVIYVNGDPIYRTESSNPVFDDSLRRMVRELYVSGLEELTRSQ
jgi:hypothetical protein